MATHRRRKEVPQWKRVLNGYIRKYANRNHITVKEAKQLEIIQNIMIWMKLKYGEGERKE